MKGWLLIETLALLALAHAIVWFALAVGWPWLSLPTLAAATRVRYEKPNGFPAAFLPE